MKARVKGAHGRSVSEMNPSDLISCDRNDVMNFSMWDECDGCWRAGGGATSPSLRFVWTKSACKMWKCAREFGWSKKCAWGQLKRRANDKVNRIGIAFLCGNRWEFFRIFPSPHSFFPHNQSPLYGCDDRLHKYDERTNKYAHVSERVKTNTDTRLKVVFRIWSGSESRKGCIDVK